MSVQPLVDVSDLGDGRLVVRLQNEPVNAWTDAFWFEYRPATQLRDRVPCCCASTTW